MKTDQPLILTARIAEDDLKPLDGLRQRHFPPDRNFLKAHLTMFHRLPGEYSGQIMKHLHAAAEDRMAFNADITGLRHLGAGVAYSITSHELLELRQQLKSKMIAWLNSQDTQKWQPHITIQNKASRSAADDLYRQLTDRFEPFSISITGFDLWHYLGGPWRPEASVLFA